MPPPPRLFGLAGTGGLAVVSHPAEVQGELGDAGGAQAGGAGDAAARVRGGVAGHGAEIQRDRAPKIRDAAAVVGGPAGDPHVVQPQVPARPVHLKDADSTGPVDRGAVAVHRDPGHDRRQPVLAAGHDRGRQGVVAPRGQVDDAAPGGVSRGDRRDELTGVAGHCLPAVEPVPPAAARNPASRSAAPPPKPAFTIDMVFIILPPLPRNSYAAVPFAILARACRSRLRRQRQLAVIISCHPCRCELDWD